MPCTIRRDPITGLEEWVCWPGGGEPGWVPGGQPPRPTGPPPPTRPPGGRPAPPAAPPPPGSQSVAPFGGLETILIFGKKSKKKLPKPPVIDLDTWLRQVRARQGYGPRAFGKPTNRSTPANEFQKQNALKLAKQAREKELLETYARDLAKKKAAEEAATKAVTAVAKRVTARGIVSTLLRSVFGVAGVAVQAIFSPLPTGSKELDEQPHDEFGRPIPTRAKPDSGDRVEPFVAIPGNFASPAPFEEIIVRATKPRGSGNTYAPNGIAPDLGPIGQPATRPVSRPDTTPAPAGRATATRDQPIARPLGYADPFSFPSTFPETKPQTRPAPKSPGKPGRFSSPLTPPNPIGVPFDAGFPRPGPNPAPKGKPETKPQSDACKKCKAEKPEQKKRKPREKCTRGTYTMKAKNIIYHPKETIPCR